MLEELLAPSPRRVQQQLWSAAPPPLPPPLTLLPDPASNHPGCPGLPGQSSRYFQDSVPAVESSMRQPRKTCRRAGTVGRAIPFAFLYNMQDSWSWPVFSRSLHALRSHLQQFPVAPGRIRPQTLRPRVGPVAWPGPKGHTRLLWQRANVASADHQLWPAATAQCQRERVQAQPSPPTLSTR